VQPGPALRVSGPDGERVVEAAHYLVATGAAPTVPPIPGLAETGHLDSTTALDLREVPESLLVVGGNAVGLEQAQLFARLGARVTVVEQLDRLVPFDEPEASAAIADAFAGDGIEVHTGAEVVRVRRTGDTVTALLRGRDGLEWLADVSHVLVATGRRPATAGLGLDDVGVGVGPRGEIVVDHHLRTGNPRIWAAGDVTGAPQFVYVAARAGGMAAENALTGAGRAMDYRHLPRVTFTDPAVASAGLTEAAARMEGIDSETRVLGIDYVPRALVTRDARGLVKLVVERKTGRLIGATVVADGAGEVIAAATYALTAGMTVDQLADAWSPYLTMAEGLRLAAQAFSRDLSTLSCCVA
jgi:mercuric reductase